MSVVDEVRADILYALRDMEGDDEKYNKVLQKFINLIRSVPVSTITICPSCIGLGHIMRGGILNPCVRCKGSGVEDGDG